VSAPGNLEEVRAEVAREDKRIRAAEERARKVAAEVAKRDEERAAERERLALKLIPAWRGGLNPVTESPAGSHSFDIGGIRGMEVTIRDIRYPVLRIIGEEVETSKGARVPLDEARRFLGILPRLVERMGQESDERIGHYSRISATSEGLRIGCHLIPYSEVRAFCADAGWPIPANLPEHL
jgi:hypothetical protein